MKKTILSVIGAVLFMVTSVASAATVEEIFNNNLPTQEEMGIKKCDLSRYIILGSQLVPDGKVKNRVNLVEDGNTFSFEYGVAPTSGSMDNVDENTGSTRSTNKGDVFHRMREGGKLKYVYESPFIKRVYIMTNCH